MKKFLGIIAVTVIVLSNVVAVQAGPQGIVDILVTIDKEISIEIGGGPINLGRIGIGETKVSATPITIKNNGSGANEIITLSVTDPAGWTFGEPGTNQYKATFQFSEDGLSGVWKVPSEVSESISYNETKKLWVNFKAPTSTDITTEQTIRLTISAE